MIMHMALGSNDTANMVSTEAKQRIVGGAMFGDPFLSGGKMLRGLPGMPSRVPAFPSILDERIKENCATSFEMTDPVCPLHLWT
jgi:hypothetical protein